MSSDLHPSLDHARVHHHMVSHKLHELAEREREIVEREAQAATNLMRGFIVLLGAVVIVALALRH